MTLQELDLVLLDLGWEYLSKWSRIRTRYRINDIAICLDQNAGYGYIAEFETILAPQEDTITAESRIRTLMMQLGVHELDQTKLEAMFDHYNQNRSDYYGSSRTFDMSANDDIIHYEFDK